MADTLSPKSRKFYERTRTKMAVSIFLGSMAMLCLAYCSAYGGQSDNANYYKKHSNNDTDEAAFQSLVGGFGFASFAFFVAFAVFLSGAIYVSPACTGSPAEKSMLNNPHELEESAYNIFVSNPLSGGSTHAKLASDEV